MPRAELCDRAPALLRRAPARQQHERRLVRPRRRRGGRRRRWRRRQRAPAASRASSRSRSTCAALSSASNTSPRERPSASNASVVRASGRVVRHDRAGPDVAVHPLDREATVVADAARHLHHELHDLHCVLARDVLREVAAREELLDGEQGSAVERLDLVPVALEDGPRRLEQHHHLGKRVLRLGVVLAPLLEDVGPHPLEAGGGDAERDRPEARHVQRPHRERDPRVEPSDREGVEEALVGDDGSVEDEVVRLRRPHAERVPRADDLEARRVDGDSVEEHHLRPERGVLELRARREVRGDVGLGEEDLASVEAVAARRPGSPSSRSPGSRRRSPPPTCTTRAPPRPSRRGGGSRRSARRPCGASASGTSATSSGAC